MSTNTGKKIFPYTLDLHVQGLHSDGCVKTLKRGVGSNRREIEQKI